VAEQYDWAPFESDKFTFTDIGDEIVGTIMEIHTETGQRGPYPVLKVKLKDGSGDKEVGCPTDLARKLAEAQPQVGDMVAMKLVELRHTGQPSPMKVFAVKVKINEPPMTEDFGDDSDEF